MSKHKKANRKKRREKERIKHKKIPESENLNELELELRDLMLVPGAQICTFGKVSEKIRKLVEKCSLNEKK